MDSSVGEGRPGGPVYWRVRRRLPTAWKGRVRRTVDRIGAPLLGSISGFDAVDAVAITLDDGPSPDTTLGILDALERWQSTATFFVLLQQARQHPELVRAITAAGHEVALHGVGHRRLTTFGSTEATEYLRRGRAELQALAGTGVCWYRPPYGAQSLRSYWATRRAGLEIVVWSCDAVDWADRDLADVVASGLARLVPGGILLLHERLEPDPSWDAPTTSFDRVAMVDEFLRRLAERGLFSRTVSELAGHPSRRTVWFRP